LSQRNRGAVSLTR